MQKCRMGVKEDQAINVGNRYGKKPIMPSGVKG
jgi:hypothetical protein